MKLLIVLAQDDYVRNYLKSGALRELQREHTCSLVLTDKCKSDFDLRGLPDVVGRVRTDKRVERAHYHLFNVLTWRHRKKSRTFYYRFSRMYKTYPYSGPINVFRNLRGLVEAARYVALGNRVVSRYAIPQLIGRIPVNADLARIVSQAKPDLAILPCSAYDPMGNDLARLGHAEGFKTLFLVDNWDNLSSKSIYWVKPDFLGVWGEQSREHAVEIHGFERDRVFNIGTPRFDNYYAASSDPSERHYAFPYVLFCGSALAFDELTALHALDDELCSKPESYGDLQIVYRPHPWRQPRLCPDVFQERDFRRVVLDVQVRDAYYRRDRAFQPDLDYYPALLRGARLVVGPLTTMLIEAIICGTPVLAIAYDDGVHYTSPHNAYRYYRHFEGIDRIAGFRINRERAHLGSELREMVEHPPAASAKEMNASLQHFLYSDERQYAERLADLVRQIASRGAAPSVGGRS